MTNKIKNKFYTYQPNEFLPIFVDGRLDNRNEFLAYKARKAAARTLYTTIMAMDAVYHSAQR